jgi:hypothetical protein
MFFQKFIVCFLIVLTVLPVPKVECKGPKPPKPPPPPPKPPKPLKVCGTSFCDDDMKTQANLNGLAWHVPNLNGGLPSSVWQTNVVNSGTMKTVSTSTSFAKYGDFCSKAQKSLFFLGSVIPNVVIPNPSWISTIPARDLDINGNLVSGFSYKLDVREVDLVSMNTMASFCKKACSLKIGCSYAAYGWEAGGWFCKMFSKAICVDTTDMWWRPAPNIISGSSCRVTDVISPNTPFLAPGSLAIAQTTPYLTTLPYLLPTSYSPVGGVVASIKCDVFDGPNTPGWPTFGLVF